MVSVAAIRGDAAEAAMLEKGVALVRERGIDFGELREAREVGLGQVVRDVPRQGVDARVRHPQRLRGLAERRARAERQVLHEARQERERQASVTSGRPAWEVRVELPSHDDVVRLAGHLAAQGWRVRPHRRHLIVGADCEDDAKGLVRELSGDGGADAETAFRVGRVSYSYMLFDASSTQVFGGGNG